MMGPMSAPLSSLLDAHTELDEVFALHQEALLMRNPAGARVQLKRFRALLVPHMQMEDALLLPLYHARAPKIPGGGLALFSAEHTKIIKTLGELEERMEHLVLTATADLPDRACRPLLKGLIAMLDREYLFKDLLAHHDAREKNVLYPQLDALTTEEERAALWPQIRSQLGEHP
jgi:iron-sulfur cluster repair protein YtfE (RIC family)